MENGTKFIRICESECQVTKEIPAELDGTLSAVTLSAYFPGATGLQFRPETFSPYRAMELHDDGKFRAPGGSWAASEFACVFSKGQKRKLEDDIDSKSTKVRRSFIESHRDIGENSKTPVTDMATIDLTDDTDEVIETVIHLPLPIRPSTPEFGGENYFDILQNLKQEQANRIDLKEETVRVSDSVYMSIQSWDEQSRHLMTTSNPDNVPDLVLDQDVLGSFVENNRDTSQFCVKSETDMPTIDLTDDVDDVIVTSIQLPQPIRPSTPEFGGDTYMGILNKIKEEPATLNLHKAEAFCVADSIKRSNQCWNEELQQVITSSNLEIVPDIASNQDVLHGFVDSQRKTDEFCDKPETDMPTIDLTDDGDDVIDTTIHLPQPIRPSTPEFGDDTYIDILNKIKQEPINKKFFNP